MIQEPRSKYQEPNQNKYDLIARCTTFAKNCKRFVFSLPERSEDRTIYGRQLLRSSSSVGANYIEANNALGKKDFVFRLKIARKEAVETLHWLDIIDKVPRVLVSECQEIKKILNAIIEKVDKT